MENPRKKPRPPHRRATGIPPYTDLARRLTEIETLLARMPTDIVAQTDELMKRYGLAAGNVTHDQLKKTVLEALQLALATAQVRTVAREPAAAAPERCDELFAWGGSFHRLPKDYILTAVGNGERPCKFRTPEQVYMRWHLPCEATGKRLPPLKKCTPRDFSLKNSKKRFSDWRMVCNYLDQLLVDKWLVPRNQTAADLQNGVPSPAYYRRRVSVALEIHWEIVKALHPRTRKRRGTNLQCALRVSTVLKDMRMVKVQIKRIKWQIRCHQGVTRLNQKIKNYWIPLYRAQFTK